jgi:hypothetical protein
MAMIKLAKPLGSNFVGNVTPIEFSVSDGVQILTNLTPMIQFTFSFTIGPTGPITFWNFFVETPFGNIRSINFGPGTAGDSASIEGAGLNLGFNRGPARSWRVVATAPDTGSTLSLMTLTLMALGLVARRFQRPAV